MQSEIIVIENQGLKDALFKGLLHFILRVKDILKHLRALSYIPLALHQQNIRAFESATNFVS